jgi:hypothetical protein
VLCQLSSKPADKNHVTSADDVTYHCLTRICIISPVLQKNIWNVTNIEWIENSKQHMYGKYRILGIIELCGSIWLWIDFKRLRKFAKIDYWFLLVCVSVGSFFRVEELSSQWTDVLKISTWEFFKNLLRIYNFNENLTLLMSTLYKDVSSFMVICRSILLKINVSEKGCSEN